MSFNFNFCRTASIAVGFICLTLEGCAFFRAHPSSQQLAKQANFQHTVISTDPFRLTSYHRLTQSGQPVVIYIEGDGFAWRSKRRVSADPTPRHPLVLHLAALDPSPNVAYLARPCQYSGIRDAACESKYWTQSRYAETVIASMNAAVDFIMEKAESAKLHLVGYSGGGAVAALLAARRDDVQSLRTLAGNLDPAAVNQYHRVSPLRGSLNPLDVAPRLNRLPQHHFVGDQDDVIPVFIAQRFLDALGEPHCAQITVLEDVTHHKGWRNHGMDLRSQPVSC